MLNLLEKEKLHEQPASYIAIAQSSAQSLLTLINDILDFSKIEAGKLELENTAFALDKQIAEVVKVLAYKIDPHQVELVVDTSELKHVEVIGDPIRFKQILMNLTSNAVKFTRAGAIVVTIKTERDGDQVILFGDVEDSGIGISDTEQQRLFASFSQVDASTTRQYGGSGLGLAIVKKLCTLMGGKVSCTSKKDVGSTFSFQLAFKASEAETNAQLQYVEAKILVVEPNQRSSSSMVNMLRNFGCTVELTANLDDASRRLHTNEIDLVIVTRHLSGQLTDQWVKQSTKQYSVRFIVLGLVQDNETLDYFEALGCSGYCQKPILQQDVVNLLSRISDNPSARQMQSEVANQNLEFNYPYHLLLVEDNAINQVVACKILANLGLTVSVVNNGSEALQYLLSYPLESEPIALILMDCQMPVMDGFEATRRIRAGEAGEYAKRLPIIALTANAMIGDQEACLAAGMTNYVAKPIQENELASALESHLPRNWSDILYANSSTK